MWIMTQIEAIFILPASKSRLKSVGLPETGLILFLAYFTLASSIEANHHQKSIWSSHAQYFWFWCRSSSKSIPNRPALEPRHATGIAAKHHVAGRERSLLPVARILLVPAMLKISQQAIMILLLDATKVRHICVRTKAHGRSLIA